MADDRPCGGDYAAARLGDPDPDQVAGSLPIDPFFVLIGVTYALTVVYSLLLKHSERHRWLVDLQLGCDAVIVSAIVYLTGGVASYFSPLYTLPIIAASTIESRRGGVMVGVLSAHPLLAAWCWSQYYGPGVLPIVVRSALLPPLRLASSRRPQRVRVPRRRRAERLPGRRRCGAPTSSWRSRRTRSPTCRRSASTSSTA